MTSRLLKAEREKSKVKILRHERMFLYSTKEKTFLLDYLTSQRLYSEHTDGTSAAVSSQFSPHVLSWP